MDSFTQVAFVASFCMYVFLLVHMFVLSMCGRSCAQSRKLLSPRQGEKPEGSGWDEYQLHFIITGKSELTLFTLLFFKRGWEFVCVSVYMLRWWWWWWAAFNLSNLDSVIQIIVMRLYYIAVFISLPLRCAKGLYPDVSLAKLYIRWSYLMLCELFDQDFHGLLNKSMFFEHFMLTSAT